MCLFSSQQIASTSGLLSGATPAHRRYAGGHNNHRALIAHTSDRFYSDVDRKAIDLKVAKGKKLIADTIESKRINLQQRKAVMVQELRDKKTKVKEKVKKIEEIVERENILTIPNLLCVGRGILAPYVGYVIVQGDYQLAIGLLVVAGITDLVIAALFEHHRIGVELIPVFCLHTVGRFHSSELGFTGKQIGLISGSNG